MRLIYIFFAFCLFLSACTKFDEEIIPGNVPPPDLTVSGSLYEDYVNRSYILALGREPDTTEFDSAMSVLNAGALSAASRESFADTVFADQDYKAHSYEEMRFDLLQTNDSAEFIQIISIFTFYLQDTSYLPLWPILTFEISRLQLLLNSKNEYYNGTIDMKELHRRMVNNYFYDQINMGSQNFVLAVFQQLINREPTQSELASGVAMVDGNNSMLFLQMGNSKDNFLNIVLNSNNYYEGQVIQLYEKYLLRIPNTYEMVNGTQDYFQNQDYIKIQKDLIRTNEFVGLN